MLLENNSKGVDNMRYKLEQKTNDRLTEWLINWEED